MPSVLGFLSVLTLGVLSALAYRTYFGSAKPEPRVAGRGATKRIDATSMPTPQGMAEEWQRLETLTDELYTREARLRDFSSALRWPSKNRYADILPFEHSRVRLRSPDNYINANFISGTRYIATQAPLPATMGDFWRMVWEQRCTVIVMLTRLTEAGRRKADAYWPPRAGVRQEYGELSVVMEREEMDEAAHTHTRVLTLCEKSMCRTVHQLHYLGWPDFGVPDCADDVVALIEKCGELSTEREGSIVVHCSAGVGRAGTFIAAAMQIADSTPSVTDTVLRLRQARPGMVQRESQFGFVYRIVDAYKRKHTV